MQGAQIDGVAPAMSGLARHRVLVVEDDQALFEVIRDYLRLSAYEVSGARSERECLGALTSGQFDLILLDLNLPDGDGLDLLAACREHLDTPLFVVSGRSDVHSRERSLEMGADDYITKPFSVRELELRMRNILRRQATKVVHGDLSAGDLPTFCGWRIDEEARHLVHCAAGQLKLTLAEYELVYMLASARGAVVRRSQMLDRLAQVANVGNPETLTALVYRLRRKLGAGGLEADPIVTLSGVGYQLKCDGAGP